MWASSGSTTSKIARCVEVKGKKTQTERDITENFAIGTRLNSNKGTKCDMEFGVIPFIDWVFGLRSTPKIAPRLVHQFWEPNPGAVP